MQVATSIGDGPRARRRNWKAKNARQSKVPTNPVVSTSRHMKPWVPSGGAAHWWHSVGLAAGQRAEAALHGAGGPVADER